MLYHRRSLAPTHFDVHECCLEAHGYAVLQPTLDFNFSVFIRFIWWVGTSEVGFGTSAELKLHFVKISNVGKTTNRYIHRNRIDVVSLRANVMETTTGVSVVSLQIDVV